MPKIKVVLAFEVSVPRRLTSHSADQLKRLRKSRDYLRSRILADRQTSIDQSHLADVADVLELAENIYRRAEACHRS